VEFGADKSHTYYKGKISAELDVSYRVTPDSVTVSIVGADGIEQDYVYQKTGYNSMILVSIPPNMPRSLLGAAHRRCGPPPVSSAEQEALQAPVAVYPGTTPALPVEAPKPDEPTPYAEAPVPSDAPVAATAALPENATSAVGTPKALTKSGSEKTKPAKVEPAPAETQQAAAPAPEAEPTPTTEGTETTAETGPTPEPTQEAAVAPASPPPPAPNNGAEQSGWDALNAGSADKAIEIWEPLARGGNTGLAVNVADMYEFGQKLPQDYAKATQWYAIAAEQGDGYAQYQMGRAYTRGMGVQIDRVQAYKWLTIAMQSLSNDQAKGKTGKASKLELESALSDIVGAMSQEEVTKAAQLVKQYDDQHKISE
jgi:hypothetical protein